MQAPKSKKLPFEALRNPKLKWNVSGLFDKDMILADMMNIIAKDFDNPAPIQSVYGCPAYLWNGEVSTIFCSKSDIENNLTVFERMRLPVFITFTNTEIEQKDLDDVSGNYLLDRISGKRNNGVMVSSDILSDYIRSKYPALKQAASLSKVAAVAKEQRTKHFYEGLADRFDRVLIHPNDNFDLKLLESLENKNKFEIVVNLNCIYGCGHLQRCLHNNKDFLEIDEQQKFLKENCIYLFDQTKLTKGQPNAKRLRSVALTTAEVDALADMGFIHFNLLGRGRPIFPYIYDLTRYVLEPDFIGPLVFKLLIGT